MPWRVKTLEALETPLARAFAGACGVALSVGLALFAVPGVLTALLTLRPRVVRLRLLVPFRALRAFEPRLTLRERAGRGEVAL